MHGHDGCGCGHAHGEMAMQDTEMEAMETGGCGEGCGCGHNGGLQAMEVAALRGFLSGVYASRLDADGLAEYLQGMGQQEDSEFQEGARFLAAAWEQVRRQEGDEEMPAAWRLLDAVSTDDEEE